jgi:C_GCAxxG_C_C family probable redox protein
LEIKKEPAATRDGSIVVDWGVEMNKVQSAVICFEEGFSCSQAVLSTFGPALGLDRDRALKVAAAFGGGMAGRGDTCGAVSGALMVIGLSYGRTRTDDEEAKERAYGLAENFMKEFESRHGSVFCRDLLGYDISTPDGLASVREENLGTTICPNFVRDAAEILEELLE